MNGEEIKDLIIPSNIISFGDFTFWGCSGLNSLTIHKDVTNIGNNVFRECSGLGSIVVEEGNAMYDSRNDCNALVLSGSNTILLGCKNTVIPNSITKIGDFSFEKTDITSIIIPNSVTEIGILAFSDCSKLNTVIIGQGINTIWSKAFEDCSKLQDFYIYSETISNKYKYYVHSDIFVGSNVSNATLHVLAPYINEYKSASPWNQFGNIVALTEEDPTGITVPSSDCSWGKTFIYDIQGHKIEHNQKGVNIIKTKNGATKKILVK